MVTIVCLGNPAIIGDSVGPRVGTALTELGINVVGTVESPVIPTTCVDMFNKVNKDTLVIVVDACIGRDSSYVRILEGPTKPGASHSDSYHEIGDMSVYCCVGSEAADLLSVKEHVVSDLVTTVVQLIQHLIQQVKTKKGIYIEELT